VQLALEATRNTALMSRAGPAIQRLRDGATLTEVVEWIEVLDGEALRHLAVAERTGNIQPILEREAREQAEAGLRSMKVLVGLLIALLVGFLVVTNILRIFESQRDYYRQLEDLSRG
jgi:type II secretory pathway component PulF